MKTDVRGRQMKRPPPDFWSFGIRGENVTPAQGVQQVISDGVEWARRIFEENGIDPSLDSERAGRLATQRGREGKGKDALQAALLVIQRAEDLRERFKSSDAKLPYSLMIFCALAWSGQVRELRRQLLTGVRVHEGGVKGRAARKAKLTAEQKADIRQEMAAAKHGVKKVIKGDLAKRHRISVREIERIAAEK